MIKGIDVSKYQGDIDYNKVKAQGIEFVIIRAGYGKLDSQKDPFFEKNYQNAKKAGLKLGAYHYSYAKTVDDAIQEAKVFLNWIRGKQFEMPVAFDIEENFQAQNGKQFVSDVIRAFCSEIEKNGYYVSVYSNKYWFDNYIDADCKKKYDTWLAHWTEKSDYQGSFGIWQYTSKGNIDGISGRVDMNECYKDYSSIMKSKGLNGFAVSNNTSTQTTTFAPRMMVSLTNTPVYISATAPNPAVKKSGTFYIYDGIEINGRYRITSSPSLAGKTPIGKNVTGYVNKADIR